MQLADGEGVDRKEILAFATERLADYKVPETLAIVDEIPRNSLGKIDRRLLLTMISLSSRRQTGLSVAKPEIPAKWTLHGALVCGVISDSMFTV